VIVRVEVRGLVQGVGFRWFASKEARRLGVAGWVRNRDDGCVEVAASGSEDAVRELIARLERGPAGARVDEVRELPADGMDSLPDPFDVRR
jgi:acylphosphatase